MINYQLSMINKSIRVTLVIGCFAAIAFSCNNLSKKTEKLPFFGERLGTYMHHVKGVAKIDTVYHIIPNFKVVDQDGDTITQANLAGKVYVADFFFTSCPSICPITEANMLTVQKHFRNAGNFNLISFSIDPRHDSAGRLKRYATRLGADTRQWYFVNGDEDQVDDLAQKGFMASAQKDSAAPGGYLHSGAFMLIDKDKRVRGVYNGTDTAEVARLIHDIPVLFKEYNEDVKDEAK